MKKWIKNLLVLLVFFIGQNAKAQQKINDLEYKDQIGYLSPNNPDFSKKFKRCSELVPIGFYSSSHPKIYKGSKAKFRKIIFENFNENGFTDTGILNLRFIINCNGEIGDIEMNELNFDFESIKLNDDLVDQLKRLSFRKENWNYQIVEKPLDYYMYLIYRIENGKVVEILP